MRARIRYRFDNLLSRGTWAVVVWLGVITFLVVLVSSALLAISGVSLSGAENSSWLEDFWQSLLRTLDTGTMAADVGWGRRLLALLVTVVGILIAGTLIGIIAAGVEQRVDDMRRARSMVIERGHVVVLGASHRLPVLVEQLALAGRSRRNNAVVVLADGDSTEIVDGVRALVPELHGTRLIVRSGDPTRAADLDMVGLPFARAVIILSGDHDSDARVVKGVLGAGALLGGFDRVPITAEVNDPETAESLLTATGGSVHILVGSFAIARIATFALREPGINQVVQQLTDFRGADLYVQEPGGLAGRPFGEAVTWFADARTIGRIRADGTVELNPPPDAVIHDDERIIVLADDAVPPSRSQLASPEAATAGGTRVAWDSEECEHVLVLGWNQLGTTLLDELATRCGRGSSVEIVYDPRLLDSADIHTPAAGGLDVRVTPSARPTWQLDGTDRLGELTSIVFLGYRDALSPDDADARTLLALMSVRRQLAGAGGSLPRLIAELVGVDTVHLVAPNEADDYIVSDAITSRLLAQLAEQPERRPILLALYGPTGPSVHVVDAGELDVAAEVAFSEIVATAYSAGLLAIGWRQGGELVLNPAEDARVELGADDHVVVIG